MINKPRGEGKIKECLAIRDMYKYYKSLKSSKKDIIDYKLFTKIIKRCNKELIDQIVFNSEIVTLPYRLGVMQISKSERSYTSIRKNKWAIDFKRSKEEGFKVFFDQKYIYRWAWKKHYAIVKNKTGYKFIASRASKRAVPEALEQGRDYYK